MKTSHRVRNFEVLERRQLFAADLSTAWSPTTNFTSEEATINLFSQHRSAGIESPSFDEGTSHTNESRWLGDNLFSGPGIDAHSPSSLTSATLQRSTVLEDAEGEPESTATASTIVIKITVDSPRVTFDSRYELARWDSLTIVSLLFQNSNLDRASREIANQNHDRTTLNSRNLVPFLASSDANDVPSLGTGKNLRSQSQATPLTSETLGGKTASDTILDKTTRWNRREIGEVPADSYWTELAFSASDFFTKDNESSVRFNPDGLADSVFGRTIELMDDEPHPSLSLVKWRWDGSDERSNNSELRSLKVWQSDCEGQTKRKFRSNESVSSSSRTARESEDGDRFAVHGLPIPSGMILLPNSTDDQVLAISLLSDSLRHGNDESIWGLSPLMHVFLQASSTLPVGSETSPASFVVETEAVSGQEDVAEAITPAQWMSLTSIAIVSGVYYIWRASTRESQEKLIAPRAETTRD